MSLPLIKYFQASAVMIGYIIGVGMFTLPYLVANAGVVSFFVLLFLLAPVQYLLHMIHVSMILNNKYYHHLPGYTGIYLGSGWKSFVFTAKFIGNMGALLAYIIITGTFLYNLLGAWLGGSPFIYATIFFVLEAMIVYFGVGMVAKAELFMTSLLVLVVGLIVYRGLPYIETENYLLLDWKLFILPFGAMLFALDGNGSLPIVTKLMKRDFKAIRKVVKFSVFFSALIIGFFTITIVGISGSATTPDALTGVHTIMDGVISLALIFGVFCMATSFVGIAESVKETLSWDLGVNRKLSWAIAVFIPYALYVLGIENLTTVISFVGSFGGGVCAIVLIVIFNKMRRAKRGTEFVDYNISAFFQTLLVLLFILGMFYTIWEFFIK